MFNFYFMKVINTIITSRYQSDLKVIKRLEAISLWRYNKSSVSLCKLCCINFLLCSSSIISSNILISNKWTYYQNKIKRTSNVKPNYYYFASYVTANEVTQLAPNNSREINRCSGEYYRFKDILKHIFLQPYR